LCRSGEDNFTAEHAESAEEYRHEWLQRRSVVPMVERRALTAEHAETAEEYRDEWLYRETALR
jgi:hypothetical protein